MGDRARFGPTGMVFAYYRAEGFDPEAWRPSYPNPAFSRMTERDAAWMARIIARFDERQLAAIIAMAEVDPGVGHRLLQTLMGRRQRILQRYLSRVSPLADPTVQSSAGRRELCLRDLGVATGVAPASRRYWARLRRERLDATFSPSAVELVMPGAPCVELPGADAASADRPMEATLDVGVERGQEPREAPAPQPLRLHVYLWREGTLVAGVERSPRHRP